MSATHTPSNPSRRHVLNSLAWSAPVLTLAVAGPLAAASTATSGGTLTLSGRAVAREGIFFTGSSYNGSGASGPYAAQQLQILITLPEGVPFTTSAPPAGFSVSVDANVVTLTNTATLSADQQTTVLNGFFITGNFLPGTAYTVRVAPPTLAIVYSGLVADGTF
ncbi:hypothetical protein [Pseudoclavibacter terrae]|uniref:hypothetical protein n=1 Tax=Pseudoclavibacter terrae TaxID=1530195 RepID=UPI00232EF535|nr:hypothetical protein [Pseudoclavibacter terrae]